MSPLAIPEYREQPELAIVALFYLLSRFPYVGCAAMAASIQRHFEWLSLDQRLPPAVQRAALDLASQWSEILAAGAQPDGTADADAVVGCPGSQTRSDRGGSGFH